MWPRTNLRRWGRIRVEDLELYGERVLHVERQQFVRQPILVGKPSSEGTSSSGSAASENSGPTGARPDAPETIKVPSSEVLKSAKVVMAGGYKASKDSGYAKLYSVWKVNGTGPGEATIQYELLDSAGKVLETTEDKINVGSGTGMTKVSNKISKAPRRREEGPHEDHQGDRGRELP